MHRARRPIQLENIILGVEGADVTTGAGAGAGALVGSENVKSTD